MTKTRDESFIDRIAELIEQSNCDHIIGGVGIADTVLIRLHSIRKYDTTAGFIRFHHCPDCGAHLEWSGYAE